VTRVVTAKPPPDALLVGWSADPQWLSTASVPARSLEAGQHGELRGRSVYIGIHAWFRDSCFTIAALVGGIAYLIQRHRDQSERLSRSVVAAVLALTLLVALACLGLLVWNPRI